MLMCIIVLLLILKVCIFIYICKFFIVKKGLVCVNSYWIYLWLKFGLSKFIYIIGFLFIK